MRNPLAKLPQKMRHRGSDLDRWMNSAFTWPDELEELDFSPAANIKETSKEFVVEVDIPGIKKEDVKIELENNRLTVSGVRNESKEESDSKHYLSESYCGSFIRSFSLPTTVDENNVQARYENGVLRLKIPKLAVSKAKEVKIQ